MMHVAYDVEAEDLPQHQAPLVVRYSEFFAMRAKARFYAEQGTNDGDRVDSTHKDAVERFCAWLEERGWR